MKRVKMAEVLAHKWVTEGAAGQIHTPELSTNKIVPETLDRPVIQYMLRSFNLNESQIQEAVTRRKPNSISATYHLICRRRLKGLGFPESPMSKYLEKWGLRKEDTSKTKEKVRSEISIGSSQLLQYHRNRRGISAFTTNGKHADTNVGRTGDAQASQREMAPDNGSERNRSSIHVLIKVKDRSSQVTDAANPHSLYAKCLEGSVSSETFKTASASSEDKTFPSVTKPPPAYLDYKEYLRQLRACRLRSGRGILKQDSPVDATVNATHYQKLNSPISINIPQVTTSPETPSPRSGTAHSPCLEVENGERRERSAKSVRFCMDDQSDECPPHTRSESRRSSCSKKPLEKFVVRRLSAHTKSRRDFSLVARIQNDKAAQSSDSEKEEKAAATYEAGDDLQRLKAMNIMWRSHQGPVVNPPPPPPNSADGQRLENSPSPKGSLSPPKTDTQSRHERKSARLSPEFKEQSRLGDGHRYKTGSGNSQPDQVNVWERNVLNLSGERLGSRQSRALPDIPMRKLGTLRSHTVSSAKCKCCLHYAYLKIN